MFSCFPVKKAVVAFTVAIGLSVSWVSIAQGGPTAELTADPGPCTPDPGRKPIPSAECDQPEGPPAPSDGIKGRAPYPRVPEVPERLPAPWQRVKIPGLTCAFDDPDTSQNEPDIIGLPPC